MKSPSEPVPFRQALLDILEAGPQREEALLAELEKRRSPGDPLYSALLSLLTHLNFTERRAARHWKRVLAHRAAMRAALGRDPGLRVALLDYFANVCGELRNPKVIEIASFERTERSAVTDGLTGLYNHVYFLQALRQELLRSRRHGLKVIEDCAQAVGAGYKGRRLGSIGDIGIYSLQASRYVTGEEPVEVNAMMYNTPGDERFKEVEETINFQLRFPSGVLANCTSSYGYSGQNRYRVVATKGWFELEPATSYRGLRLRVHRGNVIEERDLPARDHFALEMDHMSECVLENKEPLTPGEEGLRDLKVMMGIYEAARLGRTVKLSSDPS